MTDKLEVMVARIDERTGNIQEDVAELKGDVKKLSNTVNEHSEQLATINERIKNNHSPSRKQTLGFGGLGGVITGATIVIIEYFRNHV